jgi:hypothetical protein
MAIAFDQWSHNGGVPFTDDIAWDHTPIGTPRGVLVFTVQHNSAADQIVGASYGGVAMTEVALSPVSKATGETAVVYGHFLGSSIPTGTQSVSIDCTAAGASKEAICITLTAAQNTSVVDTSSIAQDTGANPAVTLSLGGIVCFCALAFHSGQAAVSGTTPLANWTSRFESDFGAGVCGIYTYNTIASTDVSAGYTATTEDCTLLAVAIREDAGGGGATQPPRTMHQFRMRRAA